MLVTKTLEVLIAIALVYFLLSTFVSIIFEWYSSLTQKRGIFLFKSIQQLINDEVNQSFGSTLYSHFLIEKLKKDKDSYPQYIPPKIFADAFIDLIGAQSDKVQIVKKKADNGEVYHEMVKPEVIEGELNILSRFQKGVETMRYSKLKNQLSYFGNRATSIEDLSAQIELWYKDYMDRVTGWYKNTTRWNLMIIGIFVALIFNFSSFEFVDELYGNNELRTSWVKEAENKVDNTIEIAENVKQTDGKQLQEYIKELKNTKSQLDSLKTDKIPFGYRDFGKKFANKGLKDWSCTLAMWFLGILVSGIALSFGAPFWFDIMSKTVNMRRAGIKS